jgi:protein TonB
MNFLKSILRWALGFVAAAVVTLGLFLILPMMQWIGEKEQKEYAIQEVVAVQEEAPPDVEEEEPEEPEQEPEEDKPELETEPLVADITQLELALGTGTGIGIPAADTTINIDSLVGGGDDFEQMFELDQLDQEPRVLYQAAPKLTDTLRRKLTSSAATVIVVFIVDARGRVANVAVQKSSDKAFDSAAVNAVKQWRFEPGQSKGKPVESRMRIPITFPKQE